MVGYAGKTVLVTGGTGFIGSRLVERLAVEEQARVRVLVHDWRKAVWVSRACVDLVQGDVRDSLSLAPALDGAHIVFHCVGVGGSREAVEQVNVRGTQNLLDASERATVERFVYLSSIAVHGPTPPDRANEKDDFRPTGQAYGDSKIAAEKVVWQYARDRQVPVTVLRPTFVWGPRSNSFTIAPIQRMKIGRWFLVDGGRGICNAVYVDNLIDAMLIAGLKEEAIGEAFLVTDGATCTWDDFFSYYARMLGLRNLPSVSSTSLSYHMKMYLVQALNLVLDIMRHAPRREPARFLIRGTRYVLSCVRDQLARSVPFDSWDLAKYATQSRIDISKVRKLLGYEPRISLEEGMRITETWLRDQRVI